MENRAELSFTLEPEIKQGKESIRTPIEGSQWNEQIMTSSDDILFSGKTWDDELRRS